MRFAILGAGAMGSVFGGHLALAGHEVTLVDVRREHIDAVRRDGLLMRRPDGTSERIALRATTDPQADLGAVDAAIVLTKSFATADAARSIAHAVGAQTWVATVQNGLGNDRALGEVLGGDRVVPGTTTVGAEQHAPGETTMNPATAQRTSITHLGPPRTAQGLPDGVVALADTLTAAGLPTQALQSADVVIWTKLALAGPMGPLSAVLRRTVRDVAEDEHGLATIRAMFEETVAVAHALGIPIDDEATWRHCRQTFAGAGPHVTSMAADVLNRRRTEIDAFCGEIVRLGEERGVPTPVNRTVWEQVRMIEGSYEKGLRDA